MWISLEFFRVFSKLTSDASGDAAPLLSVTLPSAIKSGNGPRVRFAVVTLDIDSTVNVNLLLNSVSNVVSCLKKLIVV